MIKKRMTPEQVLADVDSYRNLFSSALFPRMIIIDGEVILADCDTSIGLIDSNQLDVISKHVPAGWVQAIQRLQTLHAGAHCVIANTVSNPKLIGQLDYVYRCLQSSCVETTLTTV